MRRRSMALVALGGAVVLLAVGLAAWHPWSGYKAGTDTTAPAGHPGQAPRDFVEISRIDQDLIRSIQLISAAGTIELDGVRGTWMIEKPAVFDVKKSALDDLLYSLSNLSSERVIEEHPADLSLYGLDKPQVTVSFTLATGVARKLYLGAMTPAADSYYLMAEGDPRVFTVREHHGTYYRYTLRDLRVGAMTPIDASRVVALKILKEGRRLVEIEPTEKASTSDVEFRGTTLSVVYPWVSHPKPVDLSFLTGFVRSLQTLRPEEAVDANPLDKARYGLDKPRYELSIADGKGNTLHVMAGSRQGQVLFLQLGQDPTVYAGDPRLLDILEVDPFQFAGKNAAMIRLDTVDRLTVVAGQTRHVMEVRRVSKGSETGAQWMIDGRAVDETSFKDVYVAAISLQVDSYNDTPVSGAADITMTFSLNTGTQGELTVRFIPWSQEFYQVHKSASSDILVNRQQVKVLLERIDRLAGSAATPAPGPPPRTDVPASRS